jgi:uncharacterized protein (DUF1800 family)
MASAATEAQAFRFGYGPAGPGGDRVPQAGGGDAAVAAFPGPAADAVRAVTLRARAAQSQARAARKAGDDTAAQTALEAARHEVRALAEAAFRARIARAVATDTPFRERWAAFWADHFTVTARRGIEAALAASFAERAIRPGLFGSFAALLDAAILDPAMLLYLDQTASVGPGSRAGARRQAGLNENLAREVLELHTLGAGGGYAQTDVRQLAELLTGLALDRALRVTFLPPRAEPGAEIVLGRRYADRGLDSIRAVLGDLAAAEATSAHLSAKLVRHFVTDAPSPALEGRVRAAWQDSGGDLTVVATALLDDPATAAATPQKVRPPVEMLAAALRALGVTGAAVMALDTRAFRALILRPLQSMGQPASGPPAPDGWPEAPGDWITAQGLAARIDWAMAAPARLLRTLPDPSDFAATALGHRADPALLTAVSRAESRREGIGLVLSAPAFHRR